MNNFAPQPLTITSAQERQISQDLRPFAGKTVEIAVNNGTPQMLEFETGFARSLRNAGIEITEEDRGGQVMSSNGIPKSISFTLGPEDIELARAIANALYFRGVVTHQLEASVDRVNPGMANRCFIVISAE